MTLDKLRSQFPGDRLEYHRNAIALVPDKSDPDPGVAVLVMNGNGNIPALRCDCKAYAGKRNCPHVRALSESTRKTGLPGKTGWIDDAFRKSPWYRMAMALKDACPLEPGDLTLLMADESTNRPSWIRISDPKQQAGMTWRHTGGDTTSEDPWLLLERTGLAPTDGNGVSRGDVLNRLAAVTLTDSEQVMREKGIKNRRMALEESFWYRLGYHIHNAEGKSCAVMTMTIDEKTGRFMIRCRKGAHEIDIEIPGQKVMQVHRALGNDFPKDRFLPVWSGALESIVRVHADSSNTVKLTLYLLLHLPDGSTEAIERRRLKKYWYGDTVYIPEKQVLASWKTADRFGELFQGKYSRTIKRHRLPEIIEKMGDIFSPPNIVDESVHRLKIHRKYDRIELVPSAMDRDWCWLSVSYGFGKNVRVSLSDIYRARLSGKRYLPVENGWVDTRSVDVGTLTGQPGSTLSGQIDAGHDILRMSCMDLLRMQAASEVPLAVSEKGDGEEYGRIRSILEMRVPESFEALPGMAGSLRLYQRRGAQWLAFLHENRFGGMLCDEMGLGKTHQVMALMAWLTEKRKKPAPALVVCPTTVISHWARKIREHASALRPVVYWGADRELADMSVPGRVLITSYGILMRDITVLEKFRFSVAAFDEAQYIKNPATKSYRAARTLTADLKIAVTGTPVENRAVDLKALMDLVLPGYLGTDDMFRLHYESGDRGRHAELRRLIRPFTLRRTKVAVLDELPEKIEDIRYCRLTDTQVKLYRDAIDARGSGLLSRLEDGDADIPYIHIFALLSLLKQICNHPASIRTDSQNRPETLQTGPGNGTMGSGKWDLFVELVDTCLENGEKIVVFSQFIPMVNLILDHMKNKGVQTASITGSTRKRGEEIERFNTDPDCRVFVGSLKAGGSGIDLTGGSVVIHYDRWWNAAKEDQATDRVHRIGQTRGVQVFKLVTEGTLEEKIDALIRRKKKMAGEVIAEDDPGGLKNFTRDDLIGLLAMPEEGQSV